MFITVPDERLELVKSVLPSLSKKEEVEVKFDERNKMFNVSPKGNNSYGALKVQSIINAIGLGFDVEVAMKLLSDDIMLDVIDIKEVTHDPEDLRRLKGRVIGEKGKTKRIIFEYTGVHVSVYDHYVGLIGFYDQLQVTRKAVEMLIRGKDHSAVYKYLERAEKELRTYRISKFRPSL
ncbi:RNA-processing protein [Sulfodiicoccus acidiphilus]|uniref:RNA-processing protein n=1 Tax=Sulfodiicoccus acidiphilus TaxID=1670455 RepID=A0A348B3U5_9CREN|nr:RNA-processing protein [Sulfodiicoccus acidiphilus]BBD72847.1 RNA-processing protein [Sulfodiicoccus acidiphilus]GGT88520.1 RNA-processing protein [Sulfodiicoccus acidiphilus]